jgi:hypothetical protein
MVHLTWRRPAPLRQSAFAFVERSRRAERYFKLLIIATTGLAIAAVIRSMPWGR